MGITKTAKKYRFRTVSPTAKGVRKEIFSERGYIFSASRKNIASLHKKITMHAFFRRKNSLCLFNDVLSYAHPSKIKLAIIYDDLLKALKERNLLTMGYAY